MKKWTVLLLIFSLCVSLAACNGTGNPDHDYVLSLMERGDYDMAIQVLENLKEQSGTAAEPLSTSAAAEEPANPAITLTAEQQLVVDTVNRFLAETGNAWIEQYETTISDKARQVTVSHAVNYCWKIGKVMTVWIVC